MTNISKIIALFLFTLGVSACTDNFEEYNTNKYAVYKGVPSVLLPAMMEPLMFVQQNNSQMIDQMARTDGVDKTSIPLMLQKVGMLFHLTLPLKDL